jgi:hypothetical protein
MTTELSWDEAAAVVESCDARARGPGLACSSTAEQPCHHCPSCCFKQLDKGRTMRQSVDITRLSRIALHNLEREGEGADYSSTVAGATAAEAQQGDIRIDSADAELDFEENREEGATVGAGQHALHG